MASIIAPLFKATALFAQASNLFASGGKTKIGDLVIDVTIRENITLSSTITEHPLETKESISDHIYHNPKRIKIEGSITDSPIRLFGLLETPLQKNSITSFVNNAQSFLPFNQSAKPSIIAYELINQIWRDRTLVTVVTSLESFNNMAIANFETNKDSPIERLDFSIELMQVTFANVKVSNYNNSFKNQTIQSIASDSVNIGTVEKNTSISKQAVNYIKNLF